MKQGYEIVGYERIDMDKLEPHPLAAQIPMDDADRSSLMQSVTEVTAILQPLLVEEEAQSSGKRRILDGVNRWKTAMELKHAGGIPCLLVRGADAAAVVGASLTAGRKRSTGQRIMIWLEAHRAQVLEAARLGGGRVANMSHARNQACIENLPKHSSECFGSPSGCSAIAIAERLKCSQEDVLAGIDLLQTLEEKRVPIKAGKQDDETKARYLESVAQQRLAILSGSSGIRTWSRAVMGKHHTKGLKKAEPDYRKNLPPAMVTVRQGFKAWPNLDWEGQNQLGEGLDKEGDAKQGALLMLEALPDCLRAGLRKIIVNQWPQHERDALRIAMEKAKEEENRKAKADHKARV